MPDYLFAYGTLQPGFAPPAIRPVIDRLTLIGGGTTAGIVYDLGDYPGANFDGIGTVNGRVYLLPSGDEPAVLAAFDRYEGVPDLYVRRTVSVTTGDGQRLICWAYQYNHDPAGRVPIATGTYVRDVRP